jgi:Beta-galactosidase
MPLCVEVQDKFSDPVYPFGAVYFRKSNPPEPDWERDHKTAARMGMNIFRHWFMWASIENAPGKYDWRDYDRMVELEGQNRIKVVIAEITTSAPKWMWDKYPQGRQVDSQGSEVYPSVGGSSATGGAPMCLGNEEIRSHAEKFLTANGRALSRESRNVWLRCLERGEHAGVLLSCYLSEVQGMAESKIRQHREPWPCLASLKPWRMVVRAPSARYRRLPRFT